MDITILIGIMIGVGLVINGIGVGNFEQFVDMPSILIVVGGTLAAVMASYPLEVLLDIPRHIKVLFRGNKYEILPLIDQMVYLADIPRRDGLLALEDYVGDIKNPFLKKGILMILDVKESEKVRYIMECEIYNMQIRHEKAAGLYEAASAYAPAFGMVGTLIGLIDMLDQLDTTHSVGAATMGSAMSIALVTTFYGCMLSNLLFHPIAKKLRIRNDDEELYCKTVIEGIVAIEMGENPQVIRDNLLLFVNKSQQKKYKAKISKR